VAAKQADRGEHARLVAEARAAAGLTQRELAEQVGVSPGAIGRVEAGTLTLSVDATATLATAVGADEALRQALLSSREGVARYRSRRRGPSRSEFDELVERVAKLEAQLASGSPPAPGP
jgi:transcriptional regulator with XRE-family HTH domain